MKLCPTRSDRPTSLAPPGRTHSFSVHLVTLRTGWSVLAAVAVGLLVLVAGLTVPGLVAGEEPAAAPRSPECVVRATAPTDEIGAQEAAWVRFCPIAENRAQQVRHPAGVVTGDLAASVAAGLWQTQVDRRICAEDGGPTSGPAGFFRIEVGLADGRIAELTGDTGCSERDLVLFSQLETTLLMEAAGHLPAPGADVGGRELPGPTRRDRAPTRTERRPTCSPRPTRRRRRRPTPSSRSPPSPPTSAPTPDAARVASSSTSGRSSRGSPTRSAPRRRRRSTSARAPCAAPTPVGRRTSSCSPTRPAPHGPSRSTRPSARRSWPRPARLPRRHRSDSPDRVSSG